MSKVGKVEAFPLNQKLGKAHYDIGSEKKLELETRQSFSKGLEFDELETF